jgi:hypothetical protein
LEIFEQDRRQIEDELVWAKPAHRSDDEGSDGQVVRPGIHGEA